MSRTEKISRLCLDARKAARAFDLESMERVVESLGSELQQGEGLDEKELPHLLSNIQDLQNTLLERQNLVSQLRRRLDPSASYDTDGHEQSSATRLGRFSQRA